MLKINQLTKIWAFSPLILGVLFGVGMTPAPAQALNLALEDRNSRIDLDLTSQNGLSTWIVDGTDYLYQEWFWYRVGPSGGERSIDTLNLLNYSYVDTNSDGKKEYLQANYQGTGFDLQTRWLLTGGLPGSNISDLAEVVKITNTSNTRLDFHLFEYTDFDLNGPGNDVGVFPNIHLFQQSDAGLHAAITQFSLGDLNPRHQISSFPLLLNSLNDNAPTTLTNNPPLGTPSSPQDVTSAWQWRFSIAPGSSVIVSKDKQVGRQVQVPEPGTLLGLLAMGSLGLVSKLWKQK